MHQPRQVSSDYHYDFYLCNVSQQDIDMNEKLNAYRLKSKTGYVHNERIFSHEVLHKSNQLK